MTFVASPGIPRRSVTQWGVTASPIPGRAERRDTSGQLVGSRSQMRSRASQWGRLISNIVSVFIVVVAAGLTCLAVGPALAGYGPVVVTTGSMEPSLRPADVVVTGTPTPEKIVVGTVINYRSGNDTRIHRVIAVGADGYRTKGDANTTADSETVSFEAVKGVGFYLVPLVGYPRMWMDAGEWWKVLLALIVLVSCAYFSRVEWLSPSSTSSHTFQAAVPVRRNVREFAK